MGSAVTAKALRDMLAQKESEAQLLRARLLGWRNEKSHILKSQLQYRESLQAHERTVASLRQQAAGLPTADDASQNYQQQHALCVIAQKARESVRERLNGVRDEMAELALTLERGEVFLQKNKRVDDGFVVPPPLPISKATIPSPDTFVRVLEVMQRGESMGAEVKGKTVAARLALSADAQTLTVSDSKSKLLFSLSTFDVESITYPVRVVGKQNKSDQTNGVLKFSIDTAAQSHVLTAPSRRQLTTWLFGLMRLTAKPAQGVVSRGDVLWMQAGHKVRTDAAAAHVTPHALIATAFTQMLPAVQDPVALGESDGEEGSEQ